MDREAYTARVGRSRCTACGVPRPATARRCVACGAWSPAAPALINGYGVPRLDQVPAAPVRRVASECGPLDVLLGGGVVWGSVVLLAGAPAIGKSTLALQIARAVARVAPVLVATGEEPGADVRLRGDRLGVPVGGNVHLLDTADMANVVQAAAACRAALLVVDSLQTARVPGLTQSHGSVSYQRWALAAIRRWSKAMGVTTLVLSHVTAKGMPTGSRFVQHMVDVGLTIRGDPEGAEREIRLWKNRYGPPLGRARLVVTADGLQAVESG